MAQGFLGFWTIRNLNPKDNTPVYYTVSTPPENMP